MKIKTISTLLGALFFLAACAIQPATNIPVTATDSTENVTMTADPPLERPAVLSVMAAASLTESFTEIGKAFEAENPKVRVEFNFAGSQQLAQQLSGGAPADVFASANQKQMSVVIDEGRIDKESPLTFAQNRLVVIYPKDNPGKLSELIDLSTPGLKLILAAKEVPVGQYSLEFLDKAAQDPTYGPAFRDATLKNVVTYEDTVKAVLTKVVLGEGDAGIVYSSDIIPTAAEKVMKIDIPDELNVTATYPIAVVNDSPNLEWAQVFVNYVLSSQGQNILTKFGFIPVN